MVTLDVVGKICFGGLLIFTIGVGVSRQSRPSTESFRFTYGVPLAQGNALPQPEDTSTWMLTNCEGAYSNRICRKRADRI